MSLGTNACADPHTAGHGEVTVDGDGQQQLPADVFISRLASAHPGGLFVQLGIARPAAWLELDIPDDPARQPTIRYTRLHRNGGTTAQTVESGALVVSSPRCPCQGGQLALAIRLPDGRASSISGWFAQAGCTAWRSPPRDAYAADGDVSPSVGGHSTGDSDRIRVLHSPLCPAAETPQPVAPQPVAPHSPHGQGATGSWGSGGPYVEMEGGCAVDSEPVVVEDEGGCGGVEDDYGGYDDSGGCEGDSADSDYGDGCEGSSDADYGEGCEGDSGGAEGCEGGSGGGAACEGDAYAAAPTSSATARRSPIGLTLRSILPGLWLAWLLAPRRRRRRRRRLSAFP